MAPEHLSELSWNHLSCYIFILANTINATLSKFVRVTDCTECLLFGGHSGNAVTFGGSFAHHTEPSPALD